MTIVYNRKKVSVIIGKRFRLFVYIPTKGICLTSQNITNGNLQMQMFCIAEICMRLSNLSLYSVQSGSLAKASSIIIIRLKAISTTTDINCIGLDVYSPVLIALLTLESCVLSVRIMHS